MHALILSLALLALRVAAHAHGAAPPLPMITGAPGSVQKDDSSKACVCDAPACPPYLAKGSLCACEYNAAIFCYRRAGCPFPAPPNCEGAVLASNGTSTLTAPPRPKYTPPYEGNGGLNCVEIGYCSRPTRSKTTMVVTLNDTTTVITVPVGLPTLEAADLLPPVSSVVTTAMEAPVIFTPLPGN
ncbi:hypothetical protein EJ06DRAFT_564140 [Trichodelitschia bisporula]|uniref:Extracellular membrane protein CFEM domain-containing protein n=1 Tax=Trichodelitschia bisporula TaxID=703511 RepID=A0A6G1HS27_9PEZI|nr:hypothetical protein EJ06DRAFT_564140 [Trichodelitschia bisporula]